jgi:hypothetical protein
MPATRSSASRSSRPKAAARPAAKKAATKPAAKDAARERCEENNRVIERVTKSLEVAQADLSALRGSVGSGATDLRKDVNRLIRDARRDLTKMSKAVRRDLERAQKDLASAAKPVAKRARRGARATTTTKPRARGAAK